MNYARYLPFVGRLFIGLPFMVSGFGKIAAPGAYMAFIASSKLPLPPSLAYVGAIGVEVGCGLLVVLGFQTRIAAAIFCLFCLTTAVFFHTDFSNQDQVFHFIKNMVMTGGLLHVATYGASTLSLDSWLSSRRKGSEASMAG